MQALRSAPSLKVISRYGVGYDNVDVRAARAARIIVTTTADAPALGVAEFTIALILALLRKIPSLDHSAFDSRAFVLPQEFASLTLGLVGMGRIGRRVAELAGAIGLNLAYSHPSVRPDVTLSGGSLVAGRALDDMLMESDVISLHVPLLPTTAAMIGIRELEMMKPSAYLVNTARGGLVDESALAAALHRGIIAGAAVDVRQDDVTDGRILESRDELATAPNLILTPHVASKTMQSVDRMARQAVANLLSVKAGETPSSAI
jgi:phosphoglycerate dehydrogenase-like enzyme